MLTEKKLKIFVNNLLFSRPYHKANIIFTSNVMNGTHNNPYSVLHISNALVNTVTRYNLCFNYIAMRVSYIYIYCVIYKID